MHHEHTYVFNHRTYVLAQDTNGWQIACLRADAPTVTQTFHDYETASRTYWRRLASVILLSPRRVRGADINGTLVALVGDTDGRLHLAEHGEAVDTYVTALTDRAAALAAWRDRCAALAHRAAFLPANVGPSPADEAEEADQ